MGYFQPTTQASDASVLAAPVKLKRFSQLERQWHIRHRLGSRHVFHVPATHPRTHPAIPTRIPLRFDRLVNHLGGTTIPLGAMVIRVQPIGELLYPRVQQALADPLGYCGSRISTCRSQRRSVFLDNPVWRAISRSGKPSRKYNRLIFANIPTVITPLSPCTKSKQGTWLRGSVLRENYPSKWVKIG